MMKKLPIILCLLPFLFLSNMVIGQDNEGMHYGAKETFTYWAGEEPWEGIEVKHGQYWSSAHFSKEYIMYMEVIVPKSTALNFINDSHNKLELAGDGVDLPDGAPDWFTPPKSFKVYTREWQGSMYFIDTNTGHMFMYEVQL
ncbi:MAG: hypothetical protein AAGI38_24540 [Bacteroidota bacterium]